MAFLIRKHTFELAVPLKQAAAISRLEQSTTAKSPDGSRNTKPYRGQVDGPSFDLEDDLDYVGEGGRPVAYMRGHITETGPGLSLVKAIVGPKWGSEAFAWLWASICGGALIFLSVQALRGVWVPKWAAFWGTSAMLIGGLAFFNFTVWHSKKCFKQYLEKLYKEGRSQGEH